MTLERSILATLAYHDIFDYPLSIGEILRYLVEKKANLRSIEHLVKGLAKESKIGSLDEYFFLRGRSKIVKVRKLRERYSLLKSQRAKVFAKILKLVPPLKFVAVSGALAMNNSGKNDDIDLVLITSEGRLWTTRFLANLVLSPYKRDPRGRKIANRACLNVLVDSNDLGINPHNLYLAHEICQMKPLWDRDNTYQKFINANKWVKKYLPNWNPDGERQTTNDKRKKESKALVFSRLALVVENFLRNFQLWYMRTRITTERISDTQLFFHPADTQEWVMEEYRKRLKRLELTDLLLDKTNPALREY